MVVSAGGSLDLARMRRERHARLQTELARRGVGAALLLTSGNVFYATGAHVMPSDNARTYHQRTIALVVAGDEHPHLFTPYPEGAPPGLPSDHVHVPLYPELDEGVKEMARRLDDLLGGSLDGKLGIDDSTAPMHLGLPELVPYELTNAGSILTGVRLLKTDDEIECLRRSWAINEAANQAVEAALRPGLRESELTGIFLRELYELGATSNFLDPVFQVMPERVPDAAWSVNGDLPFALVTTDRILRDGDLIWTDTVMGYEQYASDVGRAWVVGARPTPRQRELYRRWKDITDAVLDAIRPGATGADLTRVAIEANDGVKPWLDHYFLAHGLGIEGGEIPQIGSDLGPDFDESFVLRPGMAIVVEPITWADGHGGYRAEELVVVTETGAERVSDYPDTPFV